MSSKFKLDMEEYNRILSKMRYEHNGEEETALQRVIRMYTPNEILDKLNIVDIELYLRTKKINKIKSGIKK